MSPTIPSQQTKLGRIPFPLKDFKKRRQSSLSESRPSIHSTIQPLEKNSITMSAQLLDNLLRDMEKSAAKAHTTRSALPPYEEVKYAGYDSFHDPPPVYDRRSLPAITYSSSQNGASLAIHSSMTARGPGRGGYLARSRNGRLPSRASSQRDDFCSLARSKEVRACSRRSASRGSNDQSDIHPLLRTTSETQHVRTYSTDQETRRTTEFNIPRKPLTHRIGECYQVFHESSAPMNSANNTLESSPQTSAPKSRVEGQGLPMRWPSEIAIKTKHNPETPLDAYKKWIGAKRSCHSSHAQTENKAIDSSQPRNEELEVESPVLPKSFLKRRRNFQSSNISKTDPETGVEASNARPTANDQHSIPVFRESALSSSLDSSVTEMKYPLRPDFPISSGIALQRNNLEWNVPAPSRAPPPVPTPLPASSNYIRHSVLSPKASPQIYSRTSLQTTLPWQRIRPPHSPMTPSDSNSMEHVQNWLSTSRSVASIPSEPSSPIFSEKGSSRHASTAPSSPTERGSVELEGCVPKRTGSSSKTNGMKSSITDWTDLDGCTPEFVHSIQFLKVVAPSESASDCGSRPRTPEVCTVSVENIKSDNETSVEPMKGGSEIVREDSEQPECPPIANLNENASTIKEDTYTATTTSSSYYTDSAPPTTTSERFALKSTTMQFSTSSMLAPDDKNIKSEPQSNSRSSSSSSILTGGVRLPKPQISLIIPETLPSNYNAPVSCTSYIQRELPSVPRRSSFGQMHKTEDIMKRVKALSQRADKCTPVVRSQEESLRNSAISKELSIISAVAEDTNASSMLSKEQEATEPPRVNRADCDKDAATFQKYQPTASIEETSVKPPLPPRLKTPLSPWHAILPTSPTTFFAPKSGLVLHLDRGYSSRHKCEWAITQAAYSSSPSAGTQPFNSDLRVFSYPLTGTVDFELPQGKPLFTFNSKFRGMRVAETENGKVLFVVRERWAGLASGGWMVTHKSSGASGNGADEDESVRWEAKILRSDREEAEGREMTVEWNGLEVGFVRARTGRSHLYEIMIKPYVNVCILIALMAVFDEWRTDEMLL